MIKACKHALHSCHRYGLIFLCLIVTKQVFSAEPPQAISFPVSHFSLEGKSPIPQEEITTLLASFEGKNYGLADLQAVSKHIESRIRDAGFAFYRVVLPPQSLANGKVTFELVSFTVGDIDFDGNNYFDDDNILASMPELALDNSPNTQILAQQIKVANYQPDKEVSVTFKQSEQTDKISAKIDILEHKPYQFSLTANNTGSDDTGNTRVTGAFQYSNLWNKDHRINLSYTTSPNHENDVEQYGLSYSAPLYQLGGWLSAYYAQSDINTGQVSLGGGSGLDISGSGDMFGLHYLHFLPKVANYEHGFDIGFDNRFFDNTIVLTDGGAAISDDFAPDVRSTPLTLTYKGNLPLNSVSIGHYISWSKNLGIGSKNNDAAYTESRTHAKKDWDLFRYSVFVNKDIKGWLLRTHLKGQYTNEPLVSGEQFGIGGSYSVRGYEEREISSDVGNSISFEAYTPQWKNARFLAFYDYGQGRNHDALPEEQNNWHLASIGVGIRWQWENRLQASIDIGRTLREAGITSDNHNHAHASIVMQF